MWRRVVDDNALLKQDYVAGDEFNVADNVRRDNDNFVKCYTRNVVTYGDALLGVKSGAPSPSENRISPESDLRSSVIMFIWSQVLYGS